MCETFAPFQKENCSRERALGAAWGEELRALETPSPCSRGEQEDAKTVPGWRGDRSCREEEWFRGEVSAALRLSGILPSGGGERPVTTPHAPELTVKQQGREQVREQEAAQTGHLQSFSGTSCLPRTPRAASRPGPLLPGNRCGAACALPSGPQPGTTRRGGGARRTSAAAPGRGGGSAPRLQLAGGQAGPSIIRPRDGAPYPGGAALGLQGTRSLGAGGPRAPGATLPELWVSPRPSSPGPVRAPAATRATPSCSGCHRRRSCSVSSYFPHAAGGAAGPQGGGGAGGGVREATPRHRPQSRRRGGAPRLERARRTLPLSSRPALQPPSLPASPSLFSSSLASSPLTPFTRPATSLHLLSLILLIPSPLLPQVPPFSIPPALRNLFSSSPTAHSLGASFREGLIALSTAGKERKRAVNLPASTPGSLGHCSVDGWMPHL